MELGSTMAIGWWDILWQVREVMLPLLWMGVACILMYIGLRQMGFFGDK